MLTLLLCSTQLQGPIPYLAVAASVAAVGIGIAYYFFQRHWCRTFFSLCLYVVCFMCEWCVCVCYLWWRCVCAQLYLWGTGINNCDYSFGVWSLHTSQRYTGVCIDHYQLSLGRVWNMHTCERITIQVFVLITISYPLVESEICTHVRE